MHDVAPVIQHRPGEIRFKVDDVEECPYRIPALSAASVLKKNHTNPLLAYSHPAWFEMVETSREHALAEAVHLAFSHHHPLLLTPDMIWITIAQGLAHHVSNHAEELRHEFVQHSGKVRLEIKVNEFKNPDDWPVVVDRWTSRIQEHTDPGLRELFVCDFSTTTPTSRTVSQVVMMDAFHEYFEYVLMCICGIPWVTLLGTVEDWQKIKTRVERVSRYKLDWWTHRLLPICDAFIETAAGRPPLTFWQEIYKPRKVYGGEVITGWLADMFPYLQDSETGTPTRRNPILEVPREELEVRHGISSGALPTGLSRADVKVKIEQKKLGVQLLAGFIGVYQHRETGCIQPEIGWVVLETDPFEKLLDEFLKENPEPVSVGELRGLRESSRRGQYKHLADRLGGTTLFDGTRHPWAVRRIDQLFQCRITGLPMFDMKRIIDLGDGRCVASGTTEISFLDGGKGGKSRQEFCVVVGKPILRRNEPLPPDASPLAQLFWESTRDDVHFDPADVKVVATGISQFLQRILLAGGAYYFDDPAFVPDAWLEAQR